MSSRFFVGFFSVLFTCFQLQSSELSTNTCQSDTHCMRVGLRHIENKGVGYNTGYTTLETFLAAPPELWPMTPFIDLRAHIFDDGRWAANAGMGFRKSGWNRVYGVSVYYDYRNTSQKNYNQLSFCTETLGEWVDARLNGFICAGNSISPSFNPQFSSFSGNTVLMNLTNEYGLSGTNGEIGIHLPSLKTTDFYTAGGPYYLVDSTGNGFWGGEIRANLLYKECLFLEVNYSYDSVFKNIVQGQLGIRIPFGQKSIAKRKESRPCSQRIRMNKQMVQPVNMNEIIPVNTRTTKNVAINPATGQPYFFVFVNNTSSSLGTYESPYPSFAEAQANSSPGDIIYVFPGDGTTRGMNSGIFLKADQKFWGSGVSHSIQTSEGTISIPTQTTSSPTITNTNFDTEGNAITLATNNAISGFTIDSARNDAIYGTNPQTLDVSFCTFEDTVTFAIETSFPGDATISLTNNQFVHNTNGVSLTLNGTSTVVCSDNTFERQTSVSNVPIEISANSNVLSADIENNVFNNNITGSIRVSLNTVLEADFNVLNNTITNNGTGTQATLGSSFVILLPDGTTTNNCSIVLEGNEFSTNTSNSLYLHTAGTFTNLEITASANTMSDNGSSGLVLATPVNTLTLLATDNTITRCNDNGIAVIASGSTTTGSVTINNNTITNIENASNGIAINQNFSSLNLTISNNEITNCEGTGIISYAPAGIQSLTLNVSDNTINNCQNLFSSNAASGIDIEQYTTLAGSVTNNTLSDNTGTAVIFGSTLTTPRVCLTLTGNNSTDYLLSNPGDGVFNLAPCNVGTVNTGTINTSGTITAVQSCPGATPCSP